MTRLRLAWLVLASLGGLGACTLDAGGPSFQTLGVDIEPVTATLGVPEPPPEEVITDVCVRVPVLLGSSVEREASVRGVGVKIAATRNGAKVTFPGAESSASREYSLSELRQGIAEIVDVTARGEAFEAVITSGCTNP